MDKEIEVVERPFATSNDLPPAPTFPMPVVETEAEYEARVLLTRVERPFATPDEGEKP